MKRLFILFTLYLSTLADTAYTLDSIIQNEHGWTGKLLLQQGNNEYGTDVKQLQLDIFQEADDRVRFLITDPAVNRWRVPSFTITPHNGQYAKKPQYTVKWTKSPFSIRIIRNTGEVLFDSNVPGAPLTFQDQFLQISTRLAPSSTIYGLGERISNMKLNYNTHAIWTEDIGTPEDKNLYGYHPFYMEVRNGKSHGVLLHSSNGMDVVYSNATGYDTLTYKVIGGVLDFYIFTGQNPEQVVMQYTGLVGRPYLMPYWSLGFHQCRWGYHNISEVKEVVQEYKKFDIPLETMWTDIDYMDRYLDFTFDPVRFPPQR